MPLTSAWPASSASRPMMMRIVVDLPEPFGPRKPVTRPGRTSKLRSSTAVACPYRLVSPCTWIIDCPPRIGECPHLHGTDGAEDLESGWPPDLGVGISPGKTTALPNCGGDVRGYAMTQGNPDGGPSPPPTIEEVGGGIYAYLQLAGQWGLNNSAFVVGSGAVTLVDTCFTQRRTRALLEAVRSITDRPIATLFNTHEHGDHTWGNFLLPESTTVVGHERCREGMLAAGLWAQAVFPGVAWGDIVLRPPTVTFADRLTLWVDDLRLEARYVGPAHTTSDAVLWLPERRVLFAGDLVFSGGTPFVLMGSVKGSLDGLRRLKELGAE